MPLYAHHGVQHTWLIEPIKQTVEVYRLDDGIRVENGFFAGTNQMAAPPFEAISIDLGSCWTPHRLAVI